MSKRDFLKAEIEDVAFGLALLARVRVQPGNEARVERWRERARAELADLQRRMGRVKQ